MARPKSRANDVATKGLPSTSLNRTANLAHTSYRRVRAHPQSAAAAPAGAGATGVDPRAARRCAGDCDLCRTSARLFAPHQPMPQPSPASWLGLWERPEPLRDVQVEPTTVAEIRVDNASEFGRYWHRVSRAGATSTPAPASTFSSASSRRRCGRRHLTSPQAGHWHQQEGRVDVSRTSGNIDATRAETVISSCGGFGPPTCRSLPAAPELHIPDS